MGLGKIRRQISLALRAAGITTEVLDELQGLYWMRRVLPTLAHFSSFSAPERIDIGGWISKEEKASLAMPQLYSEAKLTMQSTKSQHASRSG